MIHSVANTMEQVNLDSGHLKDFLESTREKSPEERATELEGNAKICEVHDNIAREGQTAAPSLEDNVDYHFIAFVEKDGILWDLDGRKTAPVNCGSSSKETFLQVCALPHYSRSQNFVQNSTLTTKKKVTSFSTKIFLTIFLVKSKLSTAKKSKTTSFSRVFHPKKSTIFSGNQSRIFGQKMKISKSNSVFASEASYNHFQIKDKIQKLDKTRLIKNDRNSKNGSNSKSRDSNKYFLIHFKIDLQPLYV